MVSCSLTSHQHDGQGNMGGNETVSGGGGAELTAHSLSSGEKSNIIALKHS